MQGIKIKPLVWHRDNLKGSYPARFRAEMPCKSGDYTLAGSERENLWQWFRNGYFVDRHQLHKPMPLEAAKAAAQADYEARILAALEPAPHVNETPKSEHDRADVLTDPVTLAEALQVPEVQAVVVTLQYTLKLCEDGHPVSAKNLAHACLRAIKEVE